MPSHQGTPLTGSRFDFVEAFSANDFKEHVWVHQDISGRRKKNEPAKGGNQTKNVSFRFHSYLELEVKELRNSAH